MLNYTNPHRALRTDVPFDTAPALRAGPPQWRSGQAQAHGYVQTLLLHPQKPDGTRCVVVCSAQPFGRGQPPNQPQQQPMALARRPFYEPVQPQQPVYLNLSQVTDKQVITRNSGRNLGTMGEAWVDPVRLEVVSFELESKRGVSSTVTGSIPLSTLKQIGDVVLVQDEGVLTEQPLDSRFGFVKLLGMEVRTRSGRFLGKVRDIAFNPDNGTISKIEYDDFGLRFLPVNFFDTFSVPADFVDTCSYGAVVVAAEEQQRQEKQGILSGILRGVGSRQQVAGLLTDGSRAGEAVGYLPQGYSYEQWQNDIRRWEAETGIKYEDYMVQSGQQPQQQQLGARGGLRNALPPGRPQQQPQLQQQQAGQAAVAAGQAGGPRYALPPAGGPGGRGTRPRMPQQQQQQGYGSQGQQAPPYGSGAYGGADPRYRGPSTSPAGGGGPAQPRYPAAAPQQWPQQQAAQPPAAGGQQQWGQQQPSQQQQQPQQLRPQPGAATRGSGVPGGAAPVQSQQPLQGGQQGGQYGWPGAGGGLVAPGAQGPPGAGPEGGPQATAQSSGGSLRVDEWLVREGQGMGEPSLELLGRQQPQQQQQMPTDANGWDSQGTGPQRPAPY